ncbi:hypothetical protein MKW92_020831 [Papaver armeniacum]|nr:hypothetical protein MKW92_020831 [Papaver armeniacum]
MAEMIYRSCLSVITLCSIFAILYMNSVIDGVDGKSQTFGRVLNRTKLGLKKEKLNHFRVYWHDIVGGRNPTSIQVAKAASTDKSATGFGAVSMIDDPLTEGLELKTNLLFKNGGSMNFAFLVGKYNGSTKSIMGRDKVLSEVREMPIVGGSGLFRFARGYVEARSKKLDSKTGDSTVQYNIYVFHY